MASSAGLNHNFSETYSIQNGNRKDDDSGVWLATRVCHYAMKAAEYQRVY